MLRVVVVAAVALIGGIARGEVVSPLAGGGAIDWSRGMVLATGVGLADRNAPSPAVGRAAARRRADAAARAQLAAALPAVPWVAGAGAPADLGTRAGWLADHAVVTDATLNPDGSWRVTLALPIEAIRIGLAGPRPLPASGDAAATPTIVIDARAVTGLAPVGGVAIGDGAAAGPTLWVDAEPGARVVGAKPIRRTAIGFDAGRLAVAGRVPDPAGALIIVVVGRP